MCDSRKRHAALAAGTAFLIALLGAACGISSMPSKDVWYTQHYIIMQDFERAAYRTLSEPGKAAFQELFWKVRAPNVREVFAARLEYVKKNFWKENSRQPWNTDRARVYLLNGDPAAIDYDQNVNFASTNLPGDMTGATDRSREDLGANRAEIWTYMYDKNFVKYYFVFNQPNQWRMYSAQSAANRYLGELETYSREVVFGVENIPQYQEAINALEKKK